MSLNSEEVASTFGFDVGSLVKQMKEDVGHTDPVRLKFNNGARAHAYHEGAVCVIDLPTRESIKQQMNLDEKTAKAKIVAGLAEEICHCQTHETAHNDVVVGCTLRLINKYLTPEELQFPYIREKISRLERSPERIEGTPRKVAAMEVQ